MATGHTIVWLRSCLLKNQLSCHLSIVKKLELKCQYFVTVVNPFLPSENVIPQSLLQETIK